MPECTCCNRPFSQQELIGGKCPDCKYKEIEQIIQDNWYALEQNREIVLAYMKHIKQLQAERKHYQNSIYDLQREICQLHKFLIEHYPRIFPQLSLEDKICYAEILSDSKPVDSRCKDDLDR